MVSRFEDPDFEKDPDSFETEESNDLEPRPDYQEDNAGDRFVFHDDEEEEDFKEPNYRQQNKKDDRNPIKDIQKEIDDLERKGTSNFQKKEKEAKNWFSGLNEPKKDTLSKKEIKNQNNFEDEDYIPNEDDEKEITFDEEDLPRYIGYPSYDDIGRMLFFNYMPKHARTLPYYDTSPLIFLLGIESNGFLGMNIHYLPTPLRLKLLNRLLDFVVRDPYTGKIEPQLQISYDILRGSSRHRMFRPCIKRYLNQHIGSSLQVIPFKDWPKTAALPSATFEKASPSKVWSDSRSKIGLF